MKMAITEYILNVAHAILNTVFENTVWGVNKCLEIGRGQFKHYLSVGFTLFIGHEGP
jgi:hypothetical protein